VRNWIRLIHGVPKIELYKVEKYFTPGSDQAHYRLLRKFKRAGWNEAKWLICVPQLKVFDAILDSHSMVSHYRQNQTCVLVHEKYFNVSGKHVKTFIELCEVCNHSDPVKKKVKGVRKPILSKHFRDCFQVAFIDMQARAMKDDYGTLMKWIMTLKDHFTQLTYLVPLPRKKASYVAYELDRIFGLLGYPKIFHMDNGTEFTAHEILLLLRKYNSSIITVTGQGSVGNMNKLVKRVIEQLENEDRLNGIEPNWTQMLGRCMQTINAKKGRGRHDISPYMAVFGQAYHPSINCEHNILRKCTTIEERLKASGDNRLKEVAEEVCVLGETDISCEPEVQYWEADDNIPASTLDHFELESNVESNIMSDLQAEFDIQTSADSNTNDPTPDQIDIDDNQNTIEIVPNQQIVSNTSKRRNRNHITLKEAQERQRNNVSDLYKHTDNDEPYRYIWPKLQCDICSNGHEQVMIKVGDENFLNDMGYEDNWYDIMFVNSFGFLCYHWAYTQNKCDGLKFVACDMPKQEVDSDQLLRTTTEKVLVTVFSGDGHYVVAMIDLENSSVSISDGLRYRPGMWKQHLHNVLIRCQLVSISSKCKVTVSNATYSDIEFNDKSVNVTIKWTVSLDNAFVKQSDSFSCGPLACLKLFEMFVDKDSFKGLDVDTYRHNVIQRYVYMLIIILFDCVALLTMTC
jgi:hypothetical protein